jgi:ureidoglycolate lyase
MTGPRVIVAEPLTREAFAPFGDVIDADGPTRYPINGGRCLRIHDLARVEVTGPEARVAVSMARGTPYAIPLALGMVERHPLGSQAFMPLSPDPFLVVVCPDENGRPGRPRAFLTAPGQGVNYLRNCWHGVLTPLGAERDFLIVDRAGEGNNLEEFAFEEPYEIHLP